MDASRLPPGQALTAKWPVLHYGGIPRIDTATWTFAVEGDVETPRRWTWDEFMALPRKSVRGDIHCVTAWSRFDNVFEGVSASEVIGRARPRAGAAFVMVHSYERPGFWEQNGYHIRGDPWKEERYSNPW